jgi:hypothetical protein
MDRDPELVRPILILDRIRVPVVGLDGAKPAEPRQGSRVIHGFH